MELALNQGSWFKVTLVMAILSCFGLSIWKFLKYFTLGYDFRHYSLINMRL